MKIVFNPSDGVDIRNFNHGGNVLEPHAKNSLKQYTDEDADALVANFGFLRIVTKEEAETLIAKVKEEEKAGPEEFVCKYCDKTFKAQIGLAGHLRTHKDEIALEEKPEVDTNLIPVAGAEKAKSRPAKGSESVSNIQDDPTMNIPNGKDKDGVEWYGDGYQEENKQSFAPQTPVGEKGHFGG
jgi:hypothetical protein